MFVRKKVTKSGAAKYYLVESRRDGGKVRQKVLHYLGQFATAQAELSYWERTIEMSRRDADYWRAHAAKVRDLIVAVKDRGYDDELLERIVTADELKAADYERRAVDADAHAVRCAARRDNLRSILAGRDVVPTMADPVR
jgi:hypothetical protein